MKHIALDLALLPLAPLLIAQGRRVKRDTPRLPPAAGPLSGRVEGEGEPLRVLTIGESTVAGVGAAHHEEALTGHLAHALHARAGRPVEWHAHGLSGATVAYALMSLAPQLPQQPMDLVVLAFGVNDTIDRTPPKKFAEGLKALVGAARSRVGEGVPVIVCAAPPMHQFPALPEPLRTYLGARAVMLDEAVRSARIRRAAHVALKVKAERTLFASDGFHPSPAGYAAWGAELGRVAWSAFLEKAHPDSAAPEKA